MSYPPTEEVRITKIAVVKSWLEGCGQLPTAEQIDQALLLVFSRTEQDEKIINGQIPAKKDIPF